MITEHEIQLGEKKHESKRKRQPFRGGGIPHKRRAECANIKISQSDFSNLKFGKKVNISGD